MENLYKIKMKKMVQRCPMVALSGESHPIRERHREWEREKDSRRMDERGRVRGWKEERRTDGDGQVRPIEMRWAAIYEGEVRGHGSWWCEESERERQESMEWSRHAFVPGRITPLHWIQVDPRNRKMIIRHFEISMPAGYRSRKRSIN